MEILESCLVEVIRGIIKGLPQGEQLDHILMHPDDFIEMRRNDDWRNTIGTMGDPMYERFTPDNDIINMGLCIFGISIKTSDYVRRGDILKVFRANQCDKKKLGWIWIFGSVANPTRAIHLGD